MKNWDEEGGLEKWEWILERKELGEGKEGFSGVLKQREGGCYIIIISISIIIMVNMKWCVS